MERPLLKILPRTYCHQSFRCFPQKTASTPPLVWLALFLMIWRPPINFFVVEMGAYKRGEIAELCSIAMPDIGILTGIANQHIGLFGSQENIIRGKSELLDSLKPKSTAYVNAQSKYDHSSKNPNINVIAYSTNVLPKDMRTALAACAIPAEIQINAVPGILIALTHGIEPSVIKKSIEQLTSSAKTLHTTKGWAGATIIDDTQNTSEMSATTIVSHMSSLSQPKKNSCNAVCY
ncbi:MAG: putative bifunctional UDP-N-acetylmuramoylalanyl-D-glutamate--2,6-diaminopimelate ligase/UDP-N-acetylmuramoyl-tripeptide:D-alanyl-D-alanine ligase [Microgenomates bacterium OLB23]|nr:MAG: putative bifunctional UDP-N-acetylmuramoylalanyl-D-glutamate--2,6-diaminopimelate ligase/UDP-N-acetylmuramoyl-tripeptide:D-alanyl-D-alanine ligase [Microgenomates bacterium OLB23]